MVLEISKEIERSKDEIEAQISEYTDFQDWIGSAEKEWKNFTVDEKDAFRQAFSRFQDYTRNPIQPNELKDVKKELKSAFRTPVREALRERIENINEILDLGLSNTGIETLLSSLDDHSREDLIDLREGYSSLLEEIEKAPNPIQRFLRGYLRGDQTRILRPEEDIMPKLQKALRNRAQLEKITHSVFETPWGKALEEKSIGVFSKSWLAGTSYQVSEVRDFVDEIEKSRQKYESFGINISPAIRIRFEDIIGDERSEFEEGLRKLREEIDELNSKVSIVESAINIAECDNTHTQDESASLNKKVNKITDADYNRLQALSELLEDLEQEFTNWKTRLKNKWDRQSAIADVIIGEFDFDPPDITLSETEYVSLINNQPVNASQELDALIEYISSKENELSEEMQSESVRLLYELVTKEVAQVSEFDEEAIGQLARKIPLLITIDDSERN